MLTSFTTMPAREPSRPLLNVLGRARYFGWAVLAAGSLTACSAEGLVALTAYVKTPALKVESATLGTVLSGGFDLELQQGKAASGATTVTLGSVGLRDSSGVVLDDLPVSTSPGFPLEVPVGTSHSVRFDLDAADVVDAAAEARLCATQLYFFGSVSDSLSGNVTPFSSDSFAAECP